MGGILYENVRQPTEKGAHRCPIATVIRSEKNTTQSCLHMTHHENMCARCKHICKRWKGI